MEVDAVERKILRNSNKSERSKRYHISSISNHNNSNNYIINSNNKYCISEIKE